MVCFRVVIRVCVIRFSVMSLSLQVSLDGPRVKFRTLMTVVLMTGVMMASVMGPRGSFAVWTCHWSLGGFSFSPCTNLPRFSETCLKFPGLLQFTFWHFPFYHQKIQNKQKKLNYIHSYPTPHYITQYNPNQLDNILLSITHPNGN